MTPNYLNHKTLSPVAQLCNRPILTDETHNV